MNVQHNWIKTLSISIEPSLNQYTSKLNVHNYSHMHCLYIYFHTRLVEVYFISLVFLIKWGTNANAAAVTQKLDCWGVFQRSYCSTLNMLRVASKNASMCMVQTPTDSNSQYGLRSPSTLLLLFMLPPRLWTALTVYDRLYITTMTVNCSACTETDSILLPRVWTGLPGVLWDLQYSNNWRSIGLYSHTSHSRIASTVIKR